MDLVLFTLLMELLDLNLNVKKSHMELWGKPSVLYHTIYVTTKYNIEGKIPTNSA